MHHITRVLIPALLVTFTVPCISQTTRDTLTEDVDVDQARSLMEQGDTVMVIDVRTPDEYVQGHIEGALNINIAQADFTARVSRLDRDKTYLVHCTANVSNGRSAKSMKIMRSIGFEKLLNMVGGINAWKKKAYPLVGNSFQ